MDDSLYSDDSSESKSAQSVDEETAENPTALLPLSALGGKAKVGDTLTLKILKLHGEEAEVEIVSAGDSEKSKPDSGEEPDTDKMMEA